MPRKIAGKAPLYDHCQYEDCVRPTSGLWAHYCLEHGELLKGHTKVAAKFCLVCGKKLAHYNRTGLCNRDYHRNGDRLTEYERVSPIWLEAHRYQEVPEGEGSIIPSKSSVDPAPTGYPIFNPMGGVPGIISGFMTYTDTKQEAKNGSC